MSAASCEEISDLLEPFVDDELAGPEREAVARHVRDCAACQQQADELRELRGKLRRLLPYKAPDDLAGCIEAKLAETRYPRTEHPAWRGWTKSVATHAAAALLGLAAGYWIVLSASQFDGLSRDLVGAHVRSLMAAQPIDFASGDPHRVGPWFAGKLDFAPKVRDFAAQGFPLSGGRVDYFGGRRAAVLVFRRREHMINVFITPHVGGGQLWAHEFRRNGYNVERWSDGEYDFWAISDLNQAELSTLAKLLSQS